ncbi:MAG TPA: GNAT family N-acetyltransferase [Acidimicrobiia bacterium]|nr:GNAT family N-acetyltransferase [Acidimicrobiia bacterium]
MHVRPARVSDVDDIRRIEASSGTVFDDAGMHDVAAAELPSAEHVAGYVRRGHAWVVADDRDAPVAFVLVDVVDGCAHVEQVSVAREHHHNRYGRTLLEQVATWAQARGMHALTLTTFRDVPWNAPYYERCGFRTLRDDEITPGLRDVRAHETAHGLDPDARVCMRRDLTATP